MNGLVFLLCCIEILGALLCGAQTTGEPLTAQISDSPNQDESNNKTTEFNSDLPNSSSISTSKPKATSPSPTTAEQLFKSPHTCPSLGPQPTTPHSMFFKKDCLQVLMVTGGLMIACTILLVSTLVLVWKACQLSRRIKALSSAADLASSSEHWEGTGKKDKNKSEAEPKETTVLMEEISQTQEEVGNGTAKEEGGKVNEDGQTGEDKKEEGDTSNTEEASAAPAAAAENPPSPKPEEEEPTKDVAASTSEGTEEAKDVV